MTPELRATLQNVARAMVPFLEGWWIIGSAAVALQGIEAGRVNDVDLLVDPSLAPAVVERLGVSPLTLPPDPLFRSAIFARWDVPSVPVEMMAGFELSVGGVWRPVEPQSREWIVIDDAALFVPDRPELLSLLRLFGRPKEGPRIAAMERAGATPSQASPAL
ncbi:hypothetical protein [Sphingomonas sp. 1185]|uniref:hypothetical protein n=1 Tax=Sphingomonas sp. 1185 TaxID=3156411 RepID=UPI003399DC63